MTWRPILSGEEAKRAWALVDEIDQALRAYPTEAFSLAGGTAGLALFYYSLAQARPGAGYERLVEERFSHALEKLSSEETQPGFYAGFTGVAFAAELLSPSQGEEDANEAIDDALIDYLDQEPWEADYDLINGLVGLGVYALERPRKEATLVILEGILRHLENLARPHPAGVIWWTSPDLLMEFTRVQYPEGYYNLGLSHGVPGVIALLARMLRAGFLPERVEPLLHKATSCLLSYEGAPHTKTGAPEERAAGASRFPAFVRPSEQTGSSCRTAWCYGDPGIASALWLAARATGREDWRQKALSLAREAAALNSKQALVDDIGICHGSIGLAHIWNRFYQETQEASFAEAARGYIADAFTRLRPGEGVAGVLEYTSLNMDVKTFGYRPCADLLTGAAGVGLVLVSALSGVVPHWDRLLLISDKG